MTKAYKKYTEYKDSGIEWLGEIPSHWEVKKTTFLFNLIGSGTTPTSSDISFYDGNVNWLQTGDLNNGKIVTTKKQITDKALQQFSTLKLYPINSLVIAMYGATIGKVGILDIESTTNQACCVLSKPTLNTCVPYIFYWFISAKESIISKSYGGGQPNISQDIIKSLRLPIPPLSEQEKIAEFLDKKTADIDTAIAQKEQLIELLRERKQILINKAVTRGLTPNAPLKDSGIDWIGSIPSHWEVRKLKYIGQINPSRSKSIVKRESEDEVVFLPMEKVSENWKINQELQAPIKNLWNGFTYFEKNDIILAKITPCFENGKGAYLTDLISNVGFGTTEFHVIRILNNITAQFISCFLRCDAFRRPAKEFMVGSAGQQRVPTDYLANSYIPLPPLSEKEEISNYIEEHSTKIDKAIAQKQQEIEALKEYKTTLIDSAARGRIKIN